MENFGHKFRNYVTHVKSFFVGLLLGGLGVVVAMQLLAPTRTRHVWQLSRSPIVPPPA